MILDDFYNNKSIQKSNRFRVSFVADNSRNPTTDSPFPSIKDFHVLNVSIQDWEFKKEVLKIGPFSRTFPILDGDGFEFSVTFEEDADRSIIKMIDWLQRKILVSDGLYNSPKKSCIPGVQIEILTDEGELLAVFLYTNVYIMRVNNVTLEYTNNDSVKYEIIFGSDLLKKDFNPVGGEN